MQYTTIPTDEYARLIRSEATMECLDIYLNSTEYNDIKYIKSLINHATNYLPFTLPAETCAKPETEEGWHE